LIPAGAVEELSFQEDAGVEGLLDWAAAHPASVLFTMSHGLGTPRRGWSSAEEQRALQGAMFLGPGHRLAAGDLAAKAFLPGGFWLFFASFSGGAPAHSVFYSILVEMQSRGQGGLHPDSLLRSLPMDRKRPFISALPGAALAGPDGPLGILSLIDVGFSYIFADNENQSEPARFLDVPR